jgi:hypothetical protein
VLDVGCGRGAFLSDPVETRRDLHVLKGLSQAVIGIDVDPTSEKNQAISEFRLIEGSRWPVGDESIDVCVTWFWSTSRIPSRSSPNVAAGRAPTSPRRSSRIRRAQMRARRRRRRQFPQRTCRSARFKETWRDSGSQGSGRAQRRHLALGQQTDWARPRTISSIASPSCAQVHRGKQNDLFGRSPALHPCHPYSTLPVGRRVKSSTESLESITA